MAWTEWVHSFAGMMEQEPESTDLLYSDELPELWGGWHSDAPGEKDPDATCTVALYPAPKPTVEQERLNSTLQVMHKCQEQAAGQALKASGDAVRTLLVRWKVQVGRYKNLHDTTINLAVVLFDKAMAQLRPSRAETALVSVACVLLAAKYEEREIDIPSTRSLLRHLGAKTHFKRKHVYRMEMQILQALEWKVGFATAADVLAAMSHARLEGSSDFDQSASGEALSSLQVDILRESLRAFLELSLEICFPVSCAQHEQALACVLAARAAVGISPNLNEELAMLMELGSCRLDIVEQCSLLLLDLKMSSKDLQAQPKQGP
mmetsp:Transcript_2703/g.5263  ORF Transcript_2703/g.5263 Transcript_2703/m.5263 type:complete len:320 (-) Transcript_2703:119-1078(-)